VPIANTGALAKFAANPIQTIAEAGCPKMASLSLTKEMESTRQPQWKKFRWLIALGVIAAVYVLHKVPGQRAVAELCKRDGGITINATTFVSGFFDLMYSNSCASCVDWLLPREYEWVGFQGDPSQYGGKGAPGFYRMMIRPYGSRECSSVVTAEAAPNARRREMGLRLPDDTCIALIPAGAAPNEMVLERHLSEIDYHWFNPVIVSEVRIRDMQTGRTLGQYRNYSYTSTIAKALDESNHIGRPDAECPAPAGGFFNIEQFVRQILRDESKR
jgi:hypothetical protein